MSFADESMNRQALRESLILIGIAIALGFAYAFLTKDGFFIEKKQSPSLTNSSVEMITLTIAKELYDSKNAFFVDARHEFDYGVGHIYGAINVALNEYDSHRVKLEKIPKDKILVIYCDGAECNSSIELSVKLVESGFTNVKIFFGGWKEWKSAGLPVETK